MKFAVCVDFKIKPEAWERFMVLMVANAAASLEKEEGCLQFDICTDDERPLEVFLYEIYSSPAAFDVHLASEHFRTFDREVASMIETKSVSTYRSVA